MTEAVKTGKARTAGEGEVASAAAARSEGQVLLRLLRFVRPYRSKIALLLCLDVVGIVAAAIAPWFTKYLIDDAFPNRAWGLLWRILLLMVLLEVLQWVVGLLRHTIFQYVQMRVALDLRRKLYRQLQTLSPVFFQSRPVGEHMYRNTADADAVTELAVGLLPDLFKLSFQFTLILAFTAAFDPLAALLVAGYLLPFAWINAHASTALRSVDRAERAALARRDAALQGGIAGIYTIKVFGRRFFEVLRYMRRNIAAQRIANIKYGLDKIMIERVLGKMLPWFKGKFLWVYFAVKVIRGDMTLGMIAPMLDYTERLSEPVVDIIGTFNAVRVALVPAERLMQTLDVAPAVAIPDAGRPLPPIRGDVRFENVSFRYESDRSTREDVSFHVPPGKHLAIVGPSGAGKSTLLALLLRQFDPTQGSVCVDGAALSTINPLESYLQQVGLVLQDTYLWGGTIRDNLRLARPDASDAATEKAAKEAGIHDWIAALPERYNTDLGEGTRLSVGQKQRLGIARALLINPRLLVLDEPTAALDSQTEEQVMEVLRRTRRGRTTITVTHRLHTITDADEILVMDGGRVAQRGTHESLLAVPGLYRDLYRLHTQEEAAEISEMPAEGGGSLRAKEEVLR